MKPKIVCLSLILVFVYSKVIAQAQTQQSPAEERVLEVWVWMLMQDQKLKRWTPASIGLDQSLLLYDSESISRLPENVLRLWVWNLDKKDIETLSKEKERFISSLELSPEERARAEKELEFLRQRAAEGKDMRPLVLRSLRLAEEPDGTVRRMTEKEYVANFGTEGLEEYGRSLRRQEEIRKLITKKHLTLNEIDCKEKTIAILQSVTYDTEGKVVDSIYYTYKEKDRPQSVIIPHSTGERLYREVCKKQERGEEKTK